MISEQHYPFKLRYFPNVKRESFDKDDVLVGGVLTISPSFFNEIVSIRQNLGVDNVKALEKNWQIVSVLEIFHDYGRHHIEEVSKQLLENFGLTETWNFTMKMAIVTDSIVVPQPKTAIKLIKKNDLNNWMENIKDPALLAISMLRTFSNPCILIQQATSVNELKKWLDTHNIEFNDAQRNLDEKRTFNLDEKTVYWGNLVLSLYGDKIRISKQNNTKIHWAEMANHFDELDKITEKRDGVSIFDPLEIPTSKELREIFTNYSRTLHNSGLLSTIYII